MSRIEESPPANSWQKPGDAPSDQKGFVSQKGRSYSTMSSMLRAAIYARFSSDKQRDASIEDQVAAGNRYAAMRGYEVVAVYADYAISGRSDDRPQFLQMIDDAKKGMFDVVIVWKIDRFARNMMDQFHYEREMKMHNVTLGKLPGEHFRKHHRGRYQQERPCPSRAASFAPDRR